MSTNPTGDEDLSKLQSTDQPNSSTTDELMKQILKDRKQQYGQRNVLFRVVIGVVITAIAAVIGLVALLAFTDRIEGNTIYSVFISGMTIQAFALVAIIARHLYPSGRHEANNDQDAPA